MKALDIALKDFKSMMRSMTGPLVMFGLPLLVTGLFTLMFGSMGSGIEFDLPRTRVAIANLDRQAPRLQAGNIPGNLQADTLSELVVEALQEEEMAELVEAWVVSDEAAARQAVDLGQAQAAIIIPAGFSRQFADLYDESTIYFYLDPTLTLGPEIVESILNQFMDGLSGAKIAVSLALEQGGQADTHLVGQVVQAYLEGSPVQQGEEPAEALLEVRAPGKASKEASSLSRIIGHILGGMMIFYAFFTGTITAQSILREEEQHTLPRLFTTPTRQSTILSGKFLAVFLTVLVQIVVLLSVAGPVFGIKWGEPLPMALFAGGTVLLASSSGILFNSLLKSSKQAGVIFGGVLAVTGMIGLISIFAMNSPTAAKLGNSVSLLVPQGWAVRGLKQALDGRPANEVLATTLVMLVWSAALFGLGAWRFKRRYV